MAYWTTKGQKQLSSLHEVSPQAIKCPNCLKNHFTMPMFVPFFKRNTLLLKSELMNKELSGERTRLMAAGLHCYLTTDVLTLVQMINYLKGRPSRGNMKIYVTIVSQLSKCLKFKSIRGDKNDCILHKITPRNVTNFRHLLSCDTTVYFFNKCT